MLLNPTLTVPTNWPTTRCATRNGTSVYAGSTLPKAEGWADCSPSSSTKRLTARAAFARTLRRAKRDGEVPAKLDVKNTARSLLTLAQGLAVVARANRDPAFVRGVVQTARLLLS